MENIKEILKVQGFNENDLVGFGIKDAVMPKPHDWHVQRKSIGQVIRKIESDQRKNENYYISHAIHSGKRYKYQKHDYCEIVELVIDIDYGEHHKQKSIFDTKEEALRAAGKLPMATLIIHTGGGLQVHYRFKCRYKLPEYQERYENLSKRLADYISADSCHATGHTFRLAFTTNYKKGAPVRPVEIEELNPHIEHSIEDLEEWCEKHGVPKSSISKPKAKSKISRGRKMKTRKKNPGRDRSALVYKTIERIVRKHPEVTEKEACDHLKNNSLYNHYVAKKGREMARMFFKQDFRRIKYKLTSARIPKPPNEVVKLKHEPGITTQLYKARKLFDKKVFDTNNPRMTMSLALMERLYLSGKKSILNFPCASGKTTAAIILAAAYAAPDNRMWVVTQKVQDVKRIAEQLCEIGADALEWHGRVPDCPVPREEFVSKKAKGLCGSCADKCTAQHKYLSKTPWDNEDCSILVTTHSHWQAAISNEKIGPSVKFVIVDEAPALMEYFVLDDEIESNILSLFKDSAEFACAFKEDLAFIKRMCKDGGCHKIPSLNIIRKSRKINQYIHKLLQGESISVELFGQIKSFINFFNTDEIYGMSELVNGKFKTTFIRGEVDLRTPIPHMVLDGSALMNDVYWEGFKIYECEDLKQKYPNTTIDVVDENPSKTKLRTRECFDVLLAKVQQSIEAHPHVLESKAPVVIFRNKKITNDKELAENVESLHKMIGGMELPLIDMCRGEHIGSNKAQDAVFCAVGMSLFNTISYYVLRTALVTHSEITPERIWKVLFNVPSMKSNGGFADFDIQQTYCRTVVVDLYQTIMRGCVRINPEAHYNVVCVINGPEIFQILSNELEGATFNYEHSDVVKALLEGKSDTAIQRESGIKRERLMNLKIQLNLS
jgi:hypothetical protein